MAGVVVLIGTYPRDGRRRTIAGIPLDDRLSNWLSRLVVVAALGVAATICFFVIRTLLRYMEQDRWPRRAAGLEMEELALAQKQLTQDADDLSSAADTVRILTRSLDNARDTVLLLHGELQRSRQDAIDDTSSERRRVRSE